MDLFHPEKSLGLPEGTSLETMLKVRREKALKIHPDIGGGVNGETELKEMNSAVAMKKVLKRTDFVEEVFLIEDAAYKKLLKDGAVDFTEENFKRVLPEARRLSAPKD